MLTASQTAFQFNVMGVATIPVQHRDKLPLLRSWREYQKQLPTPDQLLGWFAGDNCNVGVVTGWLGLTVLDFDEMSTYRKWLLWAARQGRLSTAATVAKRAYRVSTSRGVHVYVWVTEPERNRHMPGIDIKGRGGYVLGEGSTHPTGAQYSALTKSMVIPHVAALSDILPASLLLQQDQPVDVKPLPLPPATSTSNDPWEVASSTAVQAGDGLIDRIKRAIPIQSLFTRTENTSEDARWLRACCPLHDDTHPSFWLDTERQIGGCFCGCTTKPLDVIGLFGRIYGLSNREAIRELARRI